MYDDDTMVLIVKLGLVLGSRSTSFGNIIICVFSF